jgi:hypothetical protein
MSVLTGRVRKLALTAHVVASVGWLGAVAAYLALAITGLSSENASLVRSAYLCMELIGWSVIVPLAFATVATGLVQSLGTEWGLFRHYWVSAKFVMTVVSTIVLMVHMPKVSQMAGLAAQTVLSGADSRQLRIGLVIHPAAGLFVLLAATVLSVNKPWGRTPYGRRKQQEALMESPASAEAASSRSTGLYVALGLVGLLALLVTLHLLGAVPNHH